jgi:hypothetical protein
MVKVARKGWKREEEMSEQLCLCAHEPSSLSIQIFT